MLLDGARRVGKSYIAEEFGINEYKSYLLIDFAHLPQEVRSIFENDINDFDLFFNKLSAYYRKTLYRRDSLIIFDEVQRYPTARELIKYPVADGRYDYLETGSLISLRMNVENIVAQELRASGHKLYFYSRSDTNNRENNMEIDFLIRKKRKICPIEVKSGGYRKRSSLDKFQSKFKGKIGQAYILYTKDIVVKDDVVHLPIYMAMFL